MIESDRFRKLGLLAALPVAAFAIYISWLIVPQIVRIVVVEVAQKVATR
jgi:hypothetical protein